MSIDDQCANPHPPREPIPPAANAPLLDLSDNSPLTCQYQHPSLNEDEICEACQ